MPGPTFPVPRVWSCRTCRARKSAPRALVGRGGRGASAGLKIAQCGGGHGPMESRDVPPNQRPHSSKATTLTTNIIFVHLPKMPFVGEVSLVEGAVDSQHAAPQIRGEEKWMKAHGVKSFFGVFPNRGFPVLCSNIVLFWNCVCQGCAALWVWSGNGTQRYWAWAALKPATKYYINNMEVDNSWTGRPATEG